MTSIEATNTVISWTAPYNGGSAITRYTVSFLESDGVTYTPSPTECLADDATIISEAKCTVPSSHFVGSPFNLVWGSSIHAKVIASNWRGESLESGSGNGALIYRVPDSPINLANDDSITMATTIGLTWEKAVETGGTSVYDYRVTYDQGTGNYVVLETEITDTMFTAINLTPGMTYSFTIAARNAEGYSLESSSVEILAAQVPDTPAAPITTINGDYVDITWVDPFN